PHHQIAHNGGGFLHLFSHRRRPASLGSSMSRRPSPKRFNPSTTRTMESPGQIAKGDETPTEFCASDSISPHEMEGRCTPTPRKDRPASVRMPAAKNRVNWTIKTLEILGSTCRARMNRVERL